MRKMTFIACAALLASAVAFTGCKGDQNAPQQQMPEVKTEFSIALPNQLRNGARRMSSTSVQKDGLTDFQGMTGIYIIPFAKGSAILGTDARLGNNIHLDQNVTATDASKPSAAKVYTDVSIPLTTSSFLFYGKSAAGGDKFDTGSLTAHFEDTKTNPSDFTFDLDPIKSDFANEMLAAGKGGRLIQYLNNIASAEAGGVKWYAYEANVGLDSMFSTFSKMHGLSSFEVERVLTDLYKSLKPLVSSNTMAAAIAAAIEDGPSHTYASVNASDEVELVSDLDNFPQEFNIPVGSVDLVWSDTDKKFIEGNYSNMARPETYVYPAQLWYYVNSTIKTSNTSKQTMYDNTNDWGTILAAHTNGGSVNTRTRAVAIADTVQYAVARLDVAVKLDGATLEDNSKTAVGIKTDVNCSAGFKVTGIFVGGQKQVGFDFAPKGTTEYTIYDKKMDKPEMKAINGSLSDYNYTLVLENGNEDVMVAVEMENPSTGVDFYGVDGMLIPKGGKFYVVAKLEASAATKTSGHVFKQDYTTTANLTLKDLKHAYNTLPDLRTPQLELGFSVNLSWRNGNVYNVDFQ